MQSKNIIFDSLKESFTSIWKNKSLFILLFILQIAFLVIFSYINLIYQIKILENAKAITDYLSKQNFDEKSVTSNILQQKSILGEDPLMISRNFNEILKNFRLYLIYVFILLIVFVSMSWALTSKLVHKVNFRKLLTIFLKNLIILLFYLGLIFSFLYSLLNISFMELTFDSSKFFTKYISLLIVSIVLAYFMFISLAIISRTELKNIVQKTLLIGIKKAHYVLSVYIVNIILLSVSIFLLYYFIEKSAFILLLSIILMIFSFVFGRIFVVKVVEKLS